MHLLFSGLGTIFHAFQSGLNHRKSYFDRPVPLGNQLLALNSYYSREMLDKVKQVRLVYLVNCII